MRRLSDIIASEFPERLRDILRNVESFVSSIDEFRWEELPKPKPCKAFGIDGSRSIEKRCGVVVYAVSSVGVGDRILELHDLSVVEPFKHIEKRVEIHMQTNEARIGIFSDGLVILDGALSNLLFLIRKPKLTELYHSEISQDLNERKLKFLNDFKNDLDEWIDVLKEDVEMGLYQRETLLSKRRSGDLRVLMEFVEYLHAYDKLLEKDVVSIAKNVYESRLSECWSSGSEYIADQAIVDYIVTREFGFEKSGYFKFSYSFKGKSRIGELVEDLGFKNLEKIKVHPSYVRLRDYGNVYLFESNVDVDEVLPKVLSIEMEGYILPLIHAHRYAEIRRREMRAMMTAIMNTLADNPEFRILLKHPRSPIGD